MTLQALLGNDMSLRPPRLCSCTRRCCHGSSSVSLHRARLCSVIFTSNFLSPLFKTIFPQDLLFLLKLFRSALQTSTAMLSPLEASVSLSLRLLGATLHTQECQWLPPSCLSFNNLHIATLSLLYFLFFNVYFLRLALDSLPSRR